MLSSFALYSLEHNESLRRSASSMSTVKDFSLTLLDLRIFNGFESAYTEHRRVGVEIG